MCILLADFNFPLPIHGISRPEKTSVHFSTFRPPPTPLTPPRGSIFSGITAPLYIIVPLCGKFVGSHTPFEVYI